MANYIYTEKGIMTVKKYIAGCEEKRRHILESGIDTADNTELPTPDDILNDMNSLICVDNEGNYYNMWAVTDHHLSDYMLILEYGKDIAHSPVAVDEVRARTIGYLMGFHYDIDSKNTQRLIDEVVSRCIDIDTQDVMFNIAACVDYARDN